MRTILALAASRTVWRTAFWIYVPVLFLGTHWPALEAPSPVPRTDLYIHFTAFVVWTALMIGSRFFALRWHDRRNVVLCGLTSLVVAAFNEATQAIPALRRNAAVEDFLANAAGVGACAMIALVVGEFRARAATRRGPSNRG